ncbi:MAG: 50S ribosomal protein L28 [Candidatus Stahlbacteria bacterium]|nr:50S ribosomal protein L28 [Candidatus Stahlbacteria bacterium]
MSRRCEICGKKGLYGATISHSHRVTKRRQFPNLQKVKVKLDDKVKSIFVCTKCLKANKVEKVVHQKVEVAPLVATVEA